MNNPIRRSTTVLVVEDNTDAREIFAFVLKQSGYTVLEAENGQAALLRLQQEPVDIILTDLRMPLVDGFQLAAAVRQSAQWRHIPLIALTATPLADKRAMLNQFAELLIKPCSMDDLVSAIDKVAGA